MIIWPIKIFTKFSYYEFYNFIITTPNVRQKLGSLNRVNYLVDFDQSELKLDFTNFKLVNPRHNIFDMKL